MTEYTWHVVGICTDAVRADLDALAVETGRADKGASTFAIPLTDNGKTPTHWAFATVVTDAWLAESDAMAKALPALAAGLFLSVVPRSEEAGHFARAIAARGLSLVKDDPL